MSIVIIEEIPLHLKAYFEDLTHIELYSAHLAKKKKKKIYKSIYYSSTEKFSNRSIFWWGYGKEDSLILI